MPSVPTRVPFEPDCDRSQSAAKGPAVGFEDNQVFENERKIQSVCVFRHLKIRGRITQMRQLINF